MSNSAKSLRSLEQWCQDYLVTHPNPFNDDGLIEETFAEVENDTLDRKLIEEQVTRAVRATRVSEGFCSRCRDLFSSFPSLEDEEPTVVTVDWTYSVARIEGGARCRCRICCLIFTCLREGNDLALWYKIESRLTNGLGPQSTPTISVTLFDRHCEYLAVSPPGLRMREESTWPSAAILRSEVVTPSGTHRCWLLRSILALTWL